MDFSAVRQRVLTKTPVLRRIIEEAGTLPLATYFLRTLVAPCPVALERKTELLSVVYEKLTALFGRAVAQEACQELSERYSVSTADHQGPLTHPFFFSCHLAQAAALRSTNYRSIFVLACSGISLNNSSFPRGLLFHNEQLELERLPFFSLKYRHHVVYGMPAFVQSDIANIQPLIKQVPHVGVNRRERLSTIVKEVWEPPTSEVATSTNYYNDQISRANYALWKRLPGQADNHFISLAQEEVAAELLVKFHFGHDTLLERVFIDKETRAGFLAAFEGKTGAFTAKGRHGTVLAWALVNNERIGLWNVGNELVSADGSQRFALTAAMLKQAFQEKKLLPSMALTFMVVSFYYGLSCGGGFLQVNYLAELHTAYCFLLEKIGAPPTEVARSKQVVTDRFVADISYLFLSNHGRLVPATPYDILLYGTSDMTEKLLRLADECTLGEAFDQLVPELYQILYRAPCPVLAPFFAHTPLLYV